MFTIPVPSAATAAETVTQTSRCVCATVVTTPVGINSANYNGRNRTTSQCWFAHSCAQCRLYLFLLFTQFRYTLFCFFCSFFWRFVHTAFHIRGIQWIRLISFSCNQSFLRSSCFNCARWRRHLLNWIANQVSGDFMCVLFSVCFVYINIYICLTVEQGAVENRQESTNINERQFCSIAAILCDKKRASQTPDLCMHIWCGFYPSVGIDNPNCVWYICIFQALHSEIRCAFIC